MTFSEVQFDFKWLYIIAIVALVVGAILFFLSCFIHVKKGYIAIVERMEIYHGTYKEGNYLFAPFIYRRVGMYKTTPTEIELTICKRIIKIKIQIQDFKEYHYAHKSFNEVVNELAKQEFDDIDQFIITLQKSLTEIGCSLIK